MFILVSFDVTTGMNITKWFSYIYKKRVSTSLSHLLPVHYGQASYSFDCMQSPDQHSVCDSLCQKKKKRLKS